LKAFAIDGLYEAAKPQRLTLTAFTEFYEAAMRPLPGFWSTLRRARVAVMLCPMPLAIVRQLDETLMLNKGVWASTDIDVDKMRPLLDTQRTLAQNHYARRGIDLLPQPSTTLTAIGFTKDAFSRDPINLAGKSDHKFDVHHMNGQFGSICLEAYFEHILSRRSA